MLFVFINSSIRGSIFHTLYIFIISAVSVSTMKKNIGRLTAEGYLNDCRSNFMTDTRATDSTVNVILFIKKSKTSGKGSCNGNIDKRK